jgi:hypothetical protein
MFREICSVKFVTIVLYYHNSMYYVTEVITAMAMKSKSSGLQSHVTRRDSETFRRNKSPPYLESKYMNLELKDYIV